MSPGQLEVLARRAAAGGRFPLPRSLAGWRIARMTLHYCERVTARRGSLALIFCQLDCGAWSVAVVGPDGAIAERVFAHLPEPLRSELGPAQRRRTYVQRGA